MGFEFTQYGFDWESARVERVASVQRKKADKKKWVCIAVRNTKDDYKKQIDIYVSPSGRTVRAFRGGKELT